MAYKKNFNKNYNRNRNNYNGGHKKNNNYRYNDNKDFENRPQTRPTSNGFDATQYKKPDITIKDLNGKVYTINGNFTTTFTETLVKANKRVEEIQANEDLEYRYPELLKLLKEWCLILINQNIDGEKYTMEDVECGFNDIYVLQALISYIGDYIYDNKIFTKKQ